MYSVQVGGGDSLAVESTSGATSDGGWLSKRRKLHLSDVDLSSSQSTVVSQLVIE